ncbi:hypothetical protein GCK32_021414, partial [Trichostrongylus colubriformis]
SASHHHCWLLKYARMQPWFWDSYNSSLSHISMDFEGSLLTFAPW